MRNLGIYIHIPFCISKCNYCGFYSRGGSTGKEQEEYVETLIDDIIEYGKEYGQGRIVDTVFIGGGTPSVLEPGLIERILEAVGESFDVDRDAEISIESNPKTLTREKLLRYRKAGVNRLSIGLQSFDEGILKTLGRVHSPRDFLENFKLARDCGFDNINVDLMFGMPGHTMEIWQDTLDKVLELEPEHLSFYTLQIEEGTPFYEMYRKGEIDLVSEELDRSMYHFAIEKLRTAGYEHYEISNSCRPGYQCKHNLKYWNMEDYIGIGAGASSYVDGCRFKEAPNPEYHKNSMEDNASEFVFTGLRKREGVSLQEFQEKYGVEFWQYFKDIKPFLQRYFEEGLLIEKDDRLYLSEEGIDISNDIMAEFV